MNRRRASLRAVWVGVAISVTVLAARASAQSADADAGEDDAGAAKPAAPPRVPPEPVVTLPPATPDPQIAPIVNEPPPSRPSPAATASADRSSVLIKTFLGLSTLFTLAYLGGRPRLLALERRLGISQVITAGFPFVLLGWIARTPAVGLLTDDVLTKLAPILRVGLGGIGLVAGFRFSTQPRRTAEVMRTAAFATAVPFALVSLLSGLVLLLISGDVSSAAVRDPVFVRDALTLGTAGAMTARSTTRVYQIADPKRVLGGLLGFEELAGVAGLAIIAAYFRPHIEGSWQLPGTAWLLMTLGLGATLGLIAFLVLNRQHAAPEFVLLTLGLVGFFSGTAGYLRLSPIVIAFLAGSSLALLPELPRQRFDEAMRRLERPIYLLSLIVIGALWQIEDWRGWVLVPVFTVSRLIGKVVGIDLGLRASGLRLTRDEKQVLAVAPIGPLAIAIVVNAQLLYPSSSMSPIVAAVIAGGVLTEVVVQFASRSASIPPSRETP